MGATQSSGAGAGAAAAAARAPAALEPSASYFNADVRVVFFRSLSLLTFT